jgi:23S rRNA (uracil1939-C5)-methyltransferase
MSKTNTIDLDLTTIANLGQAMGRHEGKVVFVPLSLPGERVRVRIVEERKRWARAELVDVIDASPDRVEPPCPYYGLCGGCHWQHAAYPAQLAYKHQVVAEQLRRLGRLEAPTVRPAIGAPLVDGVPEPWFYRNHAQFTAVEPGAPLNPGAPPDLGAGPRLGFQAAGSHDVVPIERCLLLHPLLDEMHAMLDLDWPELRRLSLRAGVHTGELMCIFEAEDDDAPELEVDLPLSCLLRRHDGTDVVLIGSSAYHEVLHGRTYRVSASSFFQVNTAQAGVLLDVVHAYLDPQPTDTLLDLYCGVGVMGLSVADQVGQVIGIEEHPTAIADARANAAPSTHVQFIQGKAEALLPALEGTIAKVVLDPPRSGCKPGVLQALLRLAPERIVYVSCDPPTMARDAALLAGGGYGLVEVQPIDMFPQTYHVETVSLWCRPGSSA